MAHGVLQPDVPRLAHGDWRTAADDRRTGLAYCDPAYRDPVYRDPVG